MNKIINIYNRIVAYLTSIPIDKYLHLLCSLITILVVYGITKNYTISIVISLSIVLLKEVIDFIRYGYVDQHKDFLFDVIGLVIGLLITLLYNL